MVYLPPHFEVTDRETLVEVIRQSPLGILITLGSEGLAANHIPFIYEPDRSAATPGTLIAHVARGNRLWYDHDATRGALVVFQTAEAYIRPGWYATKQLTHEVVPTWNYAVVHVSGPLVIHDDPRWVRGAAGKLTRQMEAGRPESWKMADAPRPYTEARLQDIVGVEIPIHRMIGKLKASQNRSPADIEGAIEGLRGSNDDGDLRMAGIMDRARRDD